MTLFPILESLRVDHQGIPGSHTPGQGLLIGFADAEHGIVITDDGYLIVVPIKEVRVRWRLVEGKWVDLDQDFD